MSIPVSFWTPKADDSGLVEINDDWLIDNDYEEIYNSIGRKAGEFRYKPTRTDNKILNEHVCEPGTFYQTYGNGGGPGGWGGYWVRDGGEAVWQVEGNEFTYLDGKKLSLRSVPYFPDILHWWCKIESK